MTARATTTRISTQSGDISVAHDGPSDATAMVVLAHGAGGGMNGDFLSTVAHDLATRDCHVVRFNFPYAEIGRKSPDRQPVLEATWSAVLGHLASEGDQRPLVLGGKSMGGRIAASVVAGGARCDGLLFLGYPLHPPGRPDRLRVEHLGRIRVPMLFVAGTRDPLCSFDLLEQTVAGLGDRAGIVRIEDGDHSFRLRRSSMRSTEQAWREVADAANAWIEGLTR